MSVLAGPAATTSPLLPRPKSGPFFFCSASLINSWKLTGGFTPHDPLEAEDDDVVDFDDVAAPDDADDAEGLELG